MSSKPLLFVFLAAAIALACGQNKAGKGPRIAFDREVVDFGTHFGNEEQTLSFQISNDGTDDLVIKDIKKDCGCAEPQLTRSRIPPGEQARLSVAFRALSLGNHTKRLWVYTNDPDRREVVLQLKANGLGAAHIEPRVFTLDDEHDGEDFRAEFTIEGAPGSDFLAERFDVGESGILIKERTAQRSARKRVYELRMPRSPEPFGHRELIAVSVRLQKSGGFVRLPFPLTVKGESRPRRYLDPPALHIVGPRETNLESEIKVVAPDGGELSWAVEGLSGVRIETKGAEARLIVAATENSQRRIGRVVVRSDRGWSLSAPVQIAGWAR